MMPLAPQPRCPVLHFASQPPRRTAALGWLASASVVALMVSALAALAMAVQPSGEAMGEQEDAIALIMAPPAMELGAYSEPAPEVPVEAPDMADPAPLAETLPDLPMTEDAPPDPADLAEVPDVPEADAPPEQVEVSPPPPPEAVAEITPPPKPEPPKKKPVEQKKAPKKAKKKTVQAASAAAPSAAPAKAAAASSGSGKRAAADYPGKVMKKVLQTRKAKSPERGTVLVGFSVSGNGGLGMVKVVRSSGSAALDRIALDHIRRAAPFPAPPAGAKTNFSFEFTGR